MLVNTYCKKNLGALIEACPLNKANMVCLVLKHRLWFLSWLLTHGVGLVFSYLLAITKIVGTHNICLRAKEAPHNLCFGSHARKI